MRFLLSVVTLCLFIYSACIQAKQTELRFIVKYKTAVSTTVIKQSIMDIKGLKCNSVQPMAGGAYNLIVTPDQDKLSANDVDAILAQIKTNPQVLYAVKDRQGHFKPMPALNKDNKFIQLSHDIQWDEFNNPGGIVLETAAGKRDGAWAYTTGKSTKPIVVAVLDTGIALHPALLNNLVKDSKGQVWGWNFAGNNRNLVDETKSYHGTHVAGTIAAVSDVMLGIGEDLKILPVKIPDSSGMFYESQVINAIYWAVGGEVPGVPANPYPAKVLNMSFGVDENPGKEIDHCDAALQETMFYARKKGAVVAVAAGNDNEWEHYNAPAVCNGAIKVASTGPEGLRAYYSNYGPGISFAAPGGDIRYGRTGGILSTVNPDGGYQNSGYDFYQGTSMASPHAAGVAALVFAVSPAKITPEKVEQILYATTHPFGVSTDPNKSCVGTKPCGHGILDADNAVKVAFANYDVLFTAPELSKNLLQSCGNKQYQAGNSLQIRGEVSGQLVSSVCQEQSAYLRPTLTQQNDKIMVSYGAVHYQLDLTSFRHCDIISTDSAGCYY